MLSRLAILAALPMAVSKYFGTNFVITNAKADIRDLDVGDVEDWDEDLSPRFENNTKLIINFDSISSFGTYISSIRLSLFLIFIVHQISNRFRAEMEKRKKAAKAKLQKPAEDAPIQDQMAFMQHGENQMVFAQFTQKFAQGLDMMGTQKLSEQWHHILSTNGIVAQLYAVDPGKILIISDLPGIVPKIREFVLEQPGIDWFEHNQERFFPEGRDAPIMDHEERRELEKDLGWDKPRQYTEEKITKPDTERNAKIKKESKKKKKKSKKKKKEDQEEL